MPFLDWVNSNHAKGAAQRVPYHLLQLEQTFGDAQGAQDNLIIQGDNLQALKALLPFYTGKVKCIFIDPPYNTGGAFEHYDDKLEHSQWLSMMYPRLVLLRELLAEDGSLWITIDDDEAHYLKVLCDEVFGRSNFVANVVWQKKASPQANAIWLSDSHDHILIYSKNKAGWRPNLLPRSDDAIARYKNPDADFRGLWTSGDCTISLTGGQRGAQYAKTGFSLNIYEITTPSGRKVSPPAGTCWRFSSERFEELVNENRIWFGEDGNNVPRYKRFLNDVQDGVVPTTWWDRKDVGDNQQAKREVTFFNNDNVFSTPKPESLIQRILYLATTPNDLILDSFLGSGTTAAVAHKMNRRYIGIEMGEHAQTHCIPRLQKVIDGEQGGISKAVNWQGGGGFSFYTLGEAVFDDAGHISPSVRFQALAAYIWLLETKSAMQTTPSPQPSPTRGEGGNLATPFIGEQEGVAYYLLYNGILGDRRPNGGNVLTHAVLTYLNEVHPHAGKKVIFGEASRISEARLNTLDIVFKQIPYELHNRV